MISISDFSRRRGMTVAGMLGVALGSLVLLCGAGSVPVENLVPQGALQADLNLGGHNLTNVATATATNLVVSGSLTAPGSFALAYGQITGKPTTLSGYGITDPVVLTNASYADPAWVTSLSATKLTGALPAISGSALTGLNAAALTGTLPGGVFPATLPVASGVNLTAIPYASVTGTPTLGSLAGPSPTGTGDSSHYLRGDDTWATVAGTYTLPNATTSTLGGVIVGGGLSVASGTVSANVTSVAGRTGAVTLASTDISGLGSAATNSASAFAPAGTAGLPYSGSSTTINMTNAAGTLTVTAPAGGGLVSTQPETFPGASIPYSQSATAGTAVFFGDSITEGAGGTVSFPQMCAALGSLRNYAIYNAGIIGYTALQLNSIYNSSQSYVGSPNAGSYNVHTKLSTGTGNLLIEQAGTNDGSAIAALLNQVSTTGNLNGTTTISGLGTTTGIITGAFVVDNWTGTLTSNNTNVSDGDTVTFGAQTYRFKTTPVAANDVTIGANADGSLTNLQAAMTSYGTLAYYAGTVGCSTVNAPTAVASHALALVGRNPFASTGTAVSTTDPSLTFSSSTLTGGGKIPQGTTVTAISGGTVTLSQAETGTVTAANLAFATETVAQWQTAEQGIWSAAHTDGAKILRLTITPRIDTQFNPLLASVITGTMNPWLLTQTGTSGATVNWIVDTANCFPQSTFAGMLGQNAGFNYAGGNIYLSGYGESFSDYYLRDGIHPTNIGNAAIANAINAALNANAGTAYNLFPFNLNSFPDNWLQTDVALTDAANSFTVGQTINQSVAGTSALTLNGLSGGTASMLNLVDQFNNGKQISFDGGTEGSISAQTGGLTIAPYGSGSFVVNPSGTGFYYTQGGATRFSFNGTSQATVGAQIVIDGGSNAYHPYVQLSANGNQVWDFGNNTGVACIEATSGHPALNFLGSSNSPTAVQSLVNLQVDTAGQGLQVKEGTNAKQGTATLTAGTVTVSDTAVTANSRIFLTTQTGGGTVGMPYVSARTAGTSFTITSTSDADTSTVAWEIFEPAP